MAKAFYLTTPLYYVNASPHIGHSYTQVASDCLARYYRLKGRTVFFLTGTDEHGQKIEQAAQAAGQPPQQFVDGVVERFKALWAMLNISHDDFIRTTEPRHVRVVQACLTRLRDEKQLHHATYQGWYCTPDETFWTKEELRVGSPAATNTSSPAGTVPARSPACPSCGRALEAVAEEGWYLPLRAHQVWWQQFLASHQTFVLPQSRYNEITSLLQQPLPEYLCITRPTQRVKWGIPVPFSEQHVTYVWFDALLNYISAVGYGVDEARFSSHWPADVHVIGKDILRHHAVYWPIVLHALGFPDERMPKLVFAHGWWKVGEQKMSKSLGNIIDPYAVIRHLLNGQPFASDVYRYFLLRDVPFGQDGAFSEEALLGRLDADLANDLGNLVNRTLSMIERYNQGRMPSSAFLHEQDNEIVSEAEATVHQVETAMENLAFSQALEAIMHLVSKTNAYVEFSSPWKLAKQSDQTRRLETVLSVLADVVRVVAILLDPFMPSVSDAMWQQLGMGSSPRRFADAATWAGVPAGQKIGTRAVLFPKADSKPAG